MQTRSSSVHRYDETNPRASVNHPTTYVTLESASMRALKWIVGAVLLAGLAVGGYIVWERLSRVESTDDAQIDGAIYPLSPRVAGHVSQANVHDQASVKANDVLVQLDPSDFEVALAKARAELADAEATATSARSDIPVTSVSTASVLSGARSSRLDAAAQVSGAEQALGAARARLKTVEANVRVAEANAHKAAQDVERYKPLIARDDIPRQLYDQAVADAEARRASVDAQKAAVTEAQQNVLAAEKNVDQARAKVGQADATVEGAMTGPQQVKSSEARAQSAAAKVAQKKAEVDQAELNLKYATITAPASGIVARRAVEVGQYVEPGQQLLAIVDLSKVWVVANFKETQLKDMKVGQRADIKVDANGRTYTGHIESMAGASGARFSLLPPENATGNYVKVVQRIPVIITLDPGQNNDLSLRPGMSVTPTVHIH
jgi:membrane fusion protein (multidrug efflux system)